jgi:hypothetical protein
MGKVQEIRKEAQLAKLDSDDQQMFRERRK